jgi:hypothetical protein
MDENLKNLEILLGSMKKNHLTREEFVKEFARVLQFVKAIKDGNDKAFEKISRNIDNIGASLVKGNADDSQRTKKEAIKMVSDYINNAKKKQKETDISIKEILFNLSRIENDGIGYLENLKNEIGGRIDGSDMKIKKLREEKITDTGEQIIEKINSVKKEKIKLSQIETFDKGITKDVLDRAISILDQRTQFLIHKVSNLADVGVGGSAVYRNDGTISGTTITMTREATTVLSLVINGQFIHTFTHTSGTNIITITADEAVGFNGNDYTVIFV